MAKDAVWSYKVSSVLCALLAEFIGNVFSLWGFFHMKRRSQKTATICLSWFSYHNLSYHVLPEDFRTGNVPLEEERGPQMSHSSEELTLRVRHGDSSSVLTRLQSKTHTNPD